jgi:hypothetical protein
MKRGLAIAVACAWIGVVGCFRSEPIEGRPCPCGDGFVCCVNQCVQATDTATCHADGAIASSDADTDRNVGDGSAPRDATRDRSADVDLRVLPDASPADQASDASDAGASADRFGDGEAGDAADDARDGAQDAVVDAPTDGPACVGDGSQMTARVLGADFLHRGSTTTDEIYSGSFKLGPCERLVDNDAVVVYTQDQSFIPPLTAGLTILHTFDPAGPGMTSPAEQPPGKYYIDSPMLDHDAATDTYTYSFHGVNFVTCPDAGVCQYIDSTEFRVVIDVVW